MDPNLGDGGPMFSDSEPVTTWQILVFQILVFTTVCYFWAVRLINFFFGPAISLVLWLSSYLEVGSFDFSQTFTVVVNTICFRGLDSDSFCGPPPDEDTIQFRYATCTRQGLFAFGAAGSAALLYWVFPKLRSRPRYGLSNLLAQHGYPLSLELGVLIIFWILSRFTWATFYYLLSQFAVSIYGLALVMLLDWAVALISVIYYLVHIVPYLLVWPIPTNVLIPALVALVPVVLIVSICWSLGPEHRKNTSPTLLG